MVVALLVLNIFLTSVGISLILVLLRQKEERLGEVVSFLAKKKKPLILDPHTEEQESDLRASLGIK